MASAAGGGHKGKVENAGRPSVTDKTDVTDKTENTESKDLCAQLLVHKKLLHGDGYGRYF